MSQSAGQKTVDVGGLSRSIDQVKDRRVRNMTRTAFFAALSWLSTHGDPSVDADAVRAFLETSVATFKYYVSRGGHLETLNGSHVDSVITGLEPDLAAHAGPDAARQASTVLRGVADPDVRTLATIATAVAGTKFADINIASLARMFVASFDNIAHLKHLAAGHEPSDFLP